MVSDGTSGSLCQTTQPERARPFRPGELTWLIDDLTSLVQQFIDFKKDGPERAGIVATIVNTPPDACGKIFATLDPRQAIAYHAFNDFNIAPGIIAKIRKTYDDPLTVTDDLLVWNMSPKKITVRKLVAPSDPLPVKPPHQRGHRKQANGQSCLTGLIRAGWICRNSWRVNIR